MREQKVYNILVIDDNPADSALIKIYLEDVALPCTLLQATHLAAGIKMVYDQDVDLVLLDLSLPDSDRHTTLKLFLEKVPDIPVVVMTGYKDEIVGIQSVRAGAQDFLVKGEFDNKDLARSIKYSLQRYNRQDKLRQTAKALSLNQEDYQAVQQMANIANWDMDIVTYSMKWTEEIYPILGIKSKYINPNLNDYLNLVYSEDREVVESFFASAVKDEQIHRIKHRVLINNRIIKYIALQARVKYDQFNNKIRLIGSIQDITEHRISKDLPYSQVTPHVLPSFEQDMLRETARRQLQLLKNIYRLFSDLPTVLPSGNTQPLLEPMMLNLNQLFNSICHLFHLYHMCSEHPLPVEEKELRFADLSAQFQQLVLLLKQTDLSIELQIDPGIPNRIISDEERIQHLIITLLSLSQSPSNQLNKFEIFITSRKVKDNIIILQFIVHCQGAFSKLENIDQLTLRDKLEKWQVNREYEEWAAILAIARKIVNELKGIFQIQHKSSKNVQIELEFPVKSIPQADKRISGRQLHILLVEDHVITQIAVKRNLTNWSSDVQVDIAPNGEIGLRMFKEKSYDIVLMDLEMPVMDGRSAAGFIRSLSNIPIIGMTTQASKEEELQCLETGMNDYLLKPFAAEELFSKIIKLTGYI